MHRPATGNYLPGQDLRIRAKPLKSRAAVRGRGIRSGKTGHQKRISKKGDRKQGPQREGRRRPPKGGHPNEFKRRGPQGEPQGGPTGGPSMRDFQGGQSTGVPRRESKSGVNHRSSPRVVT
jgi:hypothetical protein